VVDGSARGEDIYMAAREDFSLATRGDLEVATREDFLMATDIACSSSEILLRPAILANRTLTTGGPTSRGHARSTPCRAELRSHSGDG
jgi:hypothetical protein